MKTEDLTIKTPSIQRILNKLIAEEIIANMFYNGCIYEAKEIAVDAFQKLFSEIADDELYDHYAQLKKWALDNGYDVPFKLKDLEKYADACVKQLNALKSAKKLAYYIDEAIKSEQDAIKSYEAALKTDDLPYDLNAIMLQNYYDEVSHLDNLTFLKYAIEAEDVA